MSKNYIRLELGGKERGLPFKAGILRQIRAIKKDDPFKTLAEANQIDQDDPEAIAGLVCTIVYASLLSACKTKKEEPDFTPDDIERWVDDLDLSDWVKVINTFNKAFSVEPSGEVGEDTQG